MSYEYTKLLWSIAFRIMEEPLQTNFKNSINQVKHSHLFPVVRRTAFLESLRSVSNSSSTSMAVRFDHFRSGTPHLLQCVVH